MPRLTLTLALVLVAACSGPTFYFPGGALTGPEEDINRAVLSGDGGLIQLETRPSDPYSVNLGAVFIDGSAYIDPAADRTWYTHIVDDPNVRVRFGDEETIYRAIAAEETENSILERFESDRIVLRLDPR